MTHSPAKVLIKDLQAIDKIDVDMFGRKAVSLAMIMSHEHIFNVPKGFCISDQLLRKMYATYDCFSNYQGSSFFDTNLPNLIIDTADSFFGNWEKNNKKLVVRSSASVEDGIHASFAGIFRSEVDIISQVQLFNAIRLCWESQFEPHVQKYSSRIGVDLNHLHLGLIIQEMIEGDISGVVFTKNPIKPDVNEMLIEAYWGQCGPVVQGIVNPFRYCIDRETNKILRLGYSAGSKSQDNMNECLSEEFLFLLTNYSTQLEILFASPQDIEWTMKGNSLYILQSRPITDIG